MPKYTWIIACSLTTVILLGLLGFSVYDKSQQLEQARLQITQANRALEDSQADGRTLSARLAEAQAHVRQLEKEREKVVQSRRNLEEEMRNSLESKDVTISQLQGKLTVNILDRILFDSGEATLKPEGAEVLRKVAVILVEHTNLTVHVIGHTDNVPIRPSARDRFPSNWELSTARATAAVRYLVQMGVDPRRLGAVGYGEFRPVADNSTPEGRARNRRIAITIMSDAMAGADTVPFAITNDMGLSLVSAATATNASWTEASQTNQTSLTGQTSQTGQTATNLPAPVPESVSPTTTSSVSPAAVTYNPSPVAATNSPAEAAPATPSQQEPAPSAK
jgi:flagellar motor protein MotB